MFEVIYWHQHFSLCYYYCNYYRTYSNHVQWNLSIYRHHWDRSTCPDNGVLIREVSSFQRLFYTLKLRYFGTPESVLNLGCHVYTDMMYTIYRLVILPMQYSIIICLYSEMCSVHDCNDSMHIMQVLLLFDLCRLVKQLIWTLFDVSIHG